MYSIISNLKEPRKVSSIFRFKNIPATLKRVEWVDLFTRPELKHRPSKNDSIHNNPVADEMVNERDDYLYSSVRITIQTRKGILIW